MEYPEPLSVLDAQGNYDPNRAPAELRPYLDELDLDKLKQFFADMYITRIFDKDASNLQRQGQLGLWIPSQGQEAVQVGAAYASRPDDYIFPAYREHAIARIRGIDPFDILRWLRGNTHGGWDPKKHNFHIYTVVIGAHALHATGYAMAINLDREKDPSVDKAVMVFYGDGATSQGDTNEAMIFAASYKTPQVFVVQNNQWAISVPVTVQSKTPIYLRAQGFGIPSWQIDGNDVMVSYALAKHALTNARNGGGPQFIEAVTYRQGAHTSSDDPTKYEDQEKRAEWLEKDPIKRLEIYLRNQGVEEKFFTDLDEEAKEYAAEIRARLIALGPPEPGKMFSSVYSEEHPVTAAQEKWLADYEASFEVEI